MKLTAKLSKQSRSEPVNQLHNQMPKDHLVYLADVYHVPLLDLADNWAPLGELAYQMKKSDVEIERLQEKLACAMAFEQAKT